MSGVEREIAGGAATSSYPVDQALQALARRVEGILQAVASSADVADDEAFRLPDDESQLRELRAALPRRPLRLDEGVRIAERQAGLLRWQLGQASATALPTVAVCGLPFLTVEARAGIAKSALVTTAGRGWVIVVNADESLVRQRFSLCHELKHVLDDPFAGRYEKGLYPGYRGVSSEDLTERVCDHFAGALLMPKMLVRRDWANRIQDSTRLARRYNVSRAAMEVRLRQLGLTESVPRCGTVSRVD